MALIPTVFLEVELGGFGAGWTNIKADLRRDSAIVMRHGIQGSGPTDLVAGRGTLTFILNNAENNSAQTLGYYSPYHASHRTGWAVGIGCRVRITDPNTAITRTRFVGRIASIAPEQGVNGGRQVFVTATDWMEEAARWLLTAAVGQQIGKRDDEIITAILTQMPRQPTAISLDAGLEVYPVALDTSSALSQPALTEFAKIAASGLSLIYVKADGTLRLEGRHSRMINTTTVMGIDGTIINDLLLPSTRDEIINSIRVTIHPKYVDPLPTTIVYSQVNSIEVAGSSTKTLLGPYRDPATRTIEIGARDVQPQIRGTDFVANTSSDGSGTDISSDFTITVTAGASGAEFLVSNANVNTGYLTVNQLRGRGVWDSGIVQFKASDSPSIYLLGENILEFDMPYQAKEGIGQGVANYLLAKFKNVFAQARTVRMFARSDALLAHLLTRDISDRIEIAEALTGVNSAYFINGVELVITPDGYVEAEYILAPAADPFSGAGYWVIGTSVLGTNTVLAPI